MENGILPNLPKGWISFQEAAKMLGVPTQSLLEGINSGDIRAYRVFYIGACRRLGFKLSDIE